MAGESERLNPTLDIVKFIRETLDSFFIGDIHMALITLHEQRVGLDT